MRAAVDFGTVVARRAQKSPPGQGGWQIFHTAWYGVDCVDPTSRIIRANGDKAFFGWPNIPQVEAEIAAWYEAKTIDEEKTIARRLNKAALDNAIYAPSGFSCRIKLGARTSPVSGKGRFRSSGGSARPFESGLNGGGNLPDRAERPRLQRVGPGMPPEPMRAG
jgi:hypothetical protein